MRPTRRLTTVLMLWLGLIMGLTTSCDTIYEDEGDCPMEVYVKFRYDYNLQRANMFADHVSAVTLYVFDDAGKLVQTQTEQNSISAEPLKDPNYEMYLKLPYGRYHFMALAGNPVSTFDPTANAGRAKFVVNSFSRQEDMTIDLAVPSAPAVHSNSVAGLPLSLPLDTLWHGLSHKIIEPNDIEVCRDTISLVRDTKQIMISLCALDDENGTDIQNFDISIVDHNAHLLWDNSVEESDAVEYRPYATWNNAGNSGEMSLPQTAHAQFMTSRIIAHTNVADDAVLNIYNNVKGENIVQLNLVDLLSRLRNYDELHRYSSQEFLDRAYDFNIEFFLKNGEPAYVDVTTYMAIGVNVLSWSRRVQFVTLD